MSLVFKYFLKRFGILLFLLNIHIGILVFGQERSFNQLTATVLLHLFSLVLFRVFLYIFFTFYINYLFLTFKAYIINCNIEMYGLGVVTKHLFWKQYNIIQILCVVFEIGPMVLKSKKSNI